MNYIKDAVAKITDVVASLLRLEKKMDKELKELKEQNQELITRIDTLTDLVLDLHHSIDKGVM